MSNETFSVISKHRGSGKLNHFMKIGLMIVLKDNKARLVLFRFIQLQANDVLLL